MTSQDPKGRVMPKRRIMRTFKLTEISAVDSPAQEGANMLLMKRSDDVDKANGFCDVLTTSTDGHQHGIEVAYYDGVPHIHVTHARAPNSDALHRHDILRGPDGKFILSENAGHTHELDVDQVANALMMNMLNKSTANSGDNPFGSVSVAAIVAGTRTPAYTGKSADAFGNQPPLGVSDMADKNADNLSAELKKRDEQIAYLKAVVDLTPDHRAVYDSLEESRREAFIAKSAIDRDAYVATLEKANPVVYTDGAGVEYRKSDDPRLVNMARERDADREDMQKFRMEAEQAAFEKRAEEVLGLVPGEKVEKIALVRAISKIDDDETKTKVYGLLEGANKVYKMAMSTQGVLDTSAPANTGIQKSADLLDQAIEACAKADGISKSDATNKVLGTTSGQALYEAARVERLNSSRARN